MNKREIFSYETDASRLVGKAVKVVFPKTVSEVQNLVKTSDLDIVPRGAGTGFVGGCVPNNSLIIDLNKMNKVLEFNTKGSVYVEAGVSLKELNEKLSQAGFEFPIQPLNFGVSTIGGMIATNAVGGRVNYERIRDWIEEIEFVNGRGELMKTSKSDLMDICGMEGITGVIVGAKLRVVPKIKKTISIFQTEDIEEVLSIVRRLKLERDVNSLDFFSKQVSKMMGLPEKYNLIIEFNSERGKVKGNEYKRIINLRDKVYYFLAKNGYYNSDAPKFFFDKLKEFILYLESNDVPYFGHLGSGIVCAFFRDDEPGKRKDVLEVVKKMKVKFGKYGIGIARKDFIDSFEAKILQRVKLRHDPFGKLNKGKIIRVEGHMFESSKPIGHSKSLEEEKIKPSVGEEISASQIVEEISDENIPEKKMEKFIDEVKKIDEVEVSEEIKEKLKDYEQTFDSELSEEKREKVESIAKNVSKEIINREGFRTRIDDGLDKPSMDFSAKPRGKVSENEQSLIDSIMMNKSREKKEEKNG